MNLPKHERPSGLLNKDATMMELVGVVLDGKGTVIQCKRWVPVSKEHLDAIQNGAVGAASVGFELDDKTRDLIAKDGNTYRLDNLLKVETIPSGSAELATGQVVESALSAAHKGFSVRGLSALTGPVKIVTDLKADSFNLTSEGLGLRGSGTLKGEVQADYPKDAVKVIVTGMPTPRDNGEYLLPDHVLDDIVRAAGSPAYITIPESRTLNLRDLARDHSIDFFKLFSAFNKAMNPLAVSSELPKAGTPAAAKPEHSGHNVNYYSVAITHPKRPEREPYTFEVEDLIQALNLGFHEGTILKSLVRSATERELGLLKQGGDAVRDAEKMVHSSQELLRARKLQRGK